MSTTQIYTHVTIRQLQLVHAMTHPAAKRRTRAQTDQNGPQPETPDAATALLAALDVEADEEASEDARQDSVAADA